MNVLSIVAFALLGYVAFVALAESLIWYFQPEMEGGVTISTIDDNGARVEWNLAGFEYKGRLYVSSNHWLRRWYYRALEHPDVGITRNGVERAYRAVSLDGAERVEISKAYKMGFVLRFVCGFAPSRFLRLDSR